MSDQKNDDILTISEDSDSEDNFHSMVSQRHTLDLFTKVPRLSFCLSPTPHRKETSSLHSPNELPDLSPVSDHETNVATQRGSGRLDTKRMGKISRDFPMLKRLSIPLVKCDQSVSSQNVRTPSKFLQEETHVRDTSSNDNKKKATRKDGQTDETALKGKGTKRQIQDSNDFIRKVARGNVYSVTCSDWQVPPRKRISEEQHAVSSPAQCETPLVSFHQPSPTRKNLPTSRISYHRQAFSSPLINPTHKKLIVNNASPMKLSEHCLPNDTLDHEPENIVQIFHRTVKRKTELDIYIEECNNIVFLNQVMNLERNTIFGCCWHVYVPNCHFERTKKKFTEYHEAFIEAALEDDENPIGEALSFLKDFQSKRCPTHQSISKIITAWKEKTTPSKEKDILFVCTLVTILKNYPEMAKSYIEDNILTHISKNNFDQPECILLMAALELDFYTRTLCDTISFRRSLLFSLLSFSKNQKQVEGIVELIRINVQNFTDVAADKDDNEQVPVLNTIKNPTRDVQSKLQCSPRVSLLEQLSVNMLSPTNALSRRPEDCKRTIENIDEAVRGLKCISKNTIKKNLNYDTNVSQKQNELASSAAIATLPSPRAAVAAALIPQYSTKGEHAHAYTDSSSARYKAMLLKSYSMSKVDTKAALIDSNALKMIRDSYPENEKENEHIESCTNFDFPDSISILEKIEMDFPQAHSDGVLPNSTTELRDIDGKNNNYLVIDETARGADLVSCNMDSDVCVYTNSTNTHAEDGEIDMQVDDPKQNLDFLDDFRYPASNTPEKHTSYGSMPRVEDQGVSKVFFHQRLLALAAESSISEEVMVASQIAELLAQAYMRVHGTHKRRLLLGSLASPLLTHVLAKRLLVDQGYILAHPHGAFVPGEAGRGSWNKDTSWNLNFENESEFLKLYSSEQQEEFAMLFYYTVWGVLEASKYNMLSCRRERLLNFGLSPPSLPHSLHRCVERVSSMADTLPAHTATILHQFLTLTSCLLEALPSQDNRGALCHP